MKFDKDNRVTGLGKKKEQDQERKRKGETSPNQPEDEPDPGDLSFDTLQQMRWALDLVRRSSFPAKQGETIVGDSLITSRQRPLRNHQSATI